MSEQKAVIKNADMTEEMQSDSIDCATQVTYTHITVIYRSEFILLNKNTL